MKSTALLDNAEACILLPSICFIRNDTLSVTKLVKRYITPLLMHMMKVEFISVQLHKPQSPSLAAIPLRTLFTTKATVNATKTAIADTWKAFKCPFGGMVTWYQKHIRDSHMNVPATNIKSWNKYAIVPYKSICDWLLVSSCAMKNASVIILSTQKTTWLR